MEQTNGNGDFGYQMEVEISSNARGSLPKKTVHVVKERDKPCNDEDEYDDLLETDYDLNEEEIDDEIDVDDEESEEEDEESIDESKITGEFSSGAFVIWKDDLHKSIETPPIWRIDGKFLVRKYVPFFRDNKTLYKRTSLFLGWNNDSKNYYHPATVVTVSETLREHIVEFKKDLIANEEPKINGIKDEVSGSNGQIDDGESLDDGEVRIEDMSFDDLEDERNGPVGEEPEKDENFTNGAFIVLKLDAAEKRPPAIWKIDFNSLIQKYDHCEGDDGKYKSTNAYDGWSIKMKNCFYPVAVVSLEESRKKHVVELKNIIRKE